MTGKWKRVYSLSVVMIVLTQCCCCIGVPLARRTTAGAPVGSMVAIRTEEAGTVSGYISPAETVAYIKEQIQTALQTTLR